MSGIKRKIEGNDPDYEDISLVQNSKRNKAAEHSGESMLWHLLYMLWQLTGTCAQVSPGSLTRVPPPALSAREAAVQKIETIIREQFSLEMKNKEHEIDVISQVCGWCWWSVFSSFHHTVFHLFCISNAEKSVLTHKVTFTFLFFVWLIVFLLFCSGSMKPGGWWTS